jgi:hypothetical protein
MERINYHRGGRAADAPLHRTCGTVAVNQTLMEQYPQFRANLLELEQSPQILRFSGKVEPEEFVIKVVVHVVYRTDQENVTDQQIQSQIDVLNRDFGATNVDIGNVPEVWKNFPMDSHIRFKLASLDPEGNESNGITRTKTDKESFGQYDSVKFGDQGGADAWPTDRYLNIWVCNLRGGLLGYAQFPGGPIETDGVVILYRAFGTTGTAEAPFNLGRTCTHEVGHFLNLRHIWGDTESCLGTDHVDDTPTQQLPNYNKPTFPHLSCDNGPHGDMFMNYMDYVDDDTMVFFTPGQVARMHAALSGPRASLIA